MTLPPQPPAVTAYFETAPAAARQGLEALRSLIFAVARDEGLDLREETRWGQPAYLAPKGSTLRIGLPKTGGFALYAHCQTPLIEEFRTATQGAFRTEGNRAVLFDRADEIAPGALAPLIRAALTYHERKG